MRTRSEVAVSRRKGPSPEALERMREADEEVVWHARCPRCYASLKGSLLDIRRHKCKLEVTNG